MSDYLKLVRKDGSNQPPVMREALSLIKRRKQALGPGAIALLEKDAQATERLVVARLSNPGLGMGAFKVIHPDAEKIIALLFPDSEPPTPSGPATALAA